MILYSIDKKIAIILFASIIEKWEKHLYLFGKFDKKQTKLPDKGSFVYGIEKAIREKTKEKSSFLNLCKKIFISFFRVKSGWAVYKSMQK